MWAIKGSSSCKLHQKWGCQLKPGKCNWILLFVRQVKLKLLQSEVPEKNIWAIFFSTVIALDIGINFFSQSLHLENCGTNIHVSRIELQMSNTKSTLDVAELVKQISTLNAWGPEFSSQLPWQCSMKSQYSITAQYQPQCHNNQPKLWFDFCNQPKLWFDFWLITNTHQKKKFSAEIARNWSWSSKQDISVESYYWRKEDQNNASITYLY